MPDTQNARGDETASVLGIIRRSTSEITEVSEIVNDAPETALAAAFHEAARRKAVRK
jgi:hypothetical protein